METVCFIIDNISNSGGTDRVLAMLSNLFKCKGHQVTVYSLKDRNPYYEINPNVSIEVPNGKNRLSKLIQCVRFVKRKKFDLVIVLSMGRLSAQIIPLLFLSQVKSYIVCSDHVSIESFSMPVRLIKYIAYLLSSKVVVLTDSDRDFLIKILPKRKVHVVRNMSPFEHETINELKLSGKENTILAVGRLTHQKNFKRLLVLWKKADIKDWSLKIVGSGDELSNLKGFCSQSGLSNVIFIEANKNLASEYLKASVLVMTSRYEGLPMVLIESKNFGVPAIAFNCKTGPSELIFDDGFLIDYHDDEKFIKKLKEITSDKCLLTELAKKAIYNSSKFSAESIYQQWLTALKK